MRVFHTWSIQPYTLRKLFHTWCRPRKPPTPRVRLNCFAYSSSSIIGYRLIYLHNNINACCNPSYHYIASSNLRENVTYSQWSADIFLSVGKLFEFGTVSLCSQTQRYVNNVCLFAITDVLLDTRLHFGDAKFQSKHKWQCAGVLVYFIHQSCEKKMGGGGIYSAVGNHKQVRFFQFDGQPMISTVFSYNSAINRLSEICSPVEQGGHVLSMQQRGSFECVSWGRVDITTVLQVGLLSGISFESAVSQSKFHLASIYSRSADCSQRQ